MPRRTLATTLAAASLTGLTALAAPAATAASSWSSAPATTTTASASAMTAAQRASIVRREAYEARLLTLVNRARAKGHLAPLTRSSCATTFAVDQATRMASQNWMRHQSLSPIAATCRGSHVGENIASGAISADQMFLWWMHSTTHRRNILNAAYTHMGNGARTDAGTVYGSQVFLRLR